MTGFIGYAEMYSGYPKSTSGQARLYSGMYDFPATTPTEFPAPGSEVSEYSDAQTQNSELSHTSSDMLKTRSDVPIELSTTLLYPV